MSADKIVALYRGRMREWEDRGWRIDTEALNRVRAQGNVVTVIPSPARRERGGWVFDPAPLLAGEVEAGDVQRPQIA